MSGSYVNNWQRRGKSDVLTASTSSRAALSEISWHVDTQEDEKDIVKSQNLSCIQTPVRIERIGAALPLLHAVVDNVKGLNGKGESI